MPVAQAQKKLTARQPKRDWVENTAQRNEWKGFGYVFAQQWDDIGLNIVGRKDIARQHHHPQPYFIHWCA